MKSVKLRATCIAVLSVLFIGMGSVHAATCTIKGQNLVVAYTKAKGNGFKFTCWDMNDTSRGFYSVPGRLGCKGRKNVPTPLWISLFSKTNSKMNGWKISSVTARGGPGSTTKDMRGYEVQLTTNVPLLAKYNVYITKMKLSHRTKACSNINSVLTDAFGE